MSPPIHDGPYIMPRESSLNYHFLSLPTRNSLQPNNTSRVTFTTVGINRLVVNSLNAWVGNLWGQIFLKGGLGGIQHKRIWKSCLTQKTTLVFLINLKTSTSQHLFGVRIQNYFSFQVHAHTVAILYYKNKKILLIKILTVEY